MKTFRIQLLFIGLLFLSSSLLATNTKLIVRAKAKDAKFIGSSIGGAYVIVKNSLTHEILSQGVISGSTGNTKLIMKEPHLRGQSIADEGTAHFLAEIDIDEPTFVTIEVKSPLNQKQATAIVSTQLWLIPGKHILGEGIVLELPGFIIDVLAPRTHQFISLKSLNNNILKIQANMVMMCGCTISNDGLWDAKKIETIAILKKSGKTIIEIPLKSTAPNLFEGEVKIDQTGAYELIIYGYQQDTGNTGVDKVNFVIND